MQLSSQHLTSSGGWAPSPPLAGAAASRHRQRGGSGSGAVAATHGAGAQRQPAAALGARLVPLAPHEVWYLGYGSNMSPQVLTGRRRVRPRESLPCWVPGYQLSFGVTGFPFSEPGFATVVRCDRSRDRHSALHGVLHRVTQQEWASIQASEGVLPGGAHASVGYQVITLDCTLYDDATAVRALTLQAAPASLHSAERQVLPSARYLRLLQEGSKHHGLDAHYQQQLHRLRPYQPVSGWQQAVGALASGAVLASAASTALPAYVLSRALQQQQQGREEEADLLTFLRRHTNASQRVMWQLHDAVLAPVLGSGCSNDSTGGTSAAASGSTGGSSNQG